MENGSCVSVMEMDSELSMNSNVTRDIDKLEPLQSCVALTAVGRVNNLHAKVSVSLP